MKELLGRSGRRSAVQVGEGERRAELMAHLIAVVRCSLVASGCAKEEPVQGAENASCFAPKRASATCKEW